MSQVLMVVTDLLHFDGVTFSELIHLLETHVAETV